MSRVLIIGAGKVSSVVLYKCCQLPEVFSEIMLAARSKRECDDIAAQLPIPIRTAQVEMDQLQKLVILMQNFGPTLCINLTLPHQNLIIMEACLECGVHYLDTVGYLPRNETRTEYKWQWAYRKRFKEAGLMALLGCGLNPGVTNIFTAWALKTEFDKVHKLDIIDGNGVGYGQPVATDFSPEINIREIMAPGRHWENGKWLESPSLTTSRELSFPEELGKKKVYLMYHEELESLTQHIPTLTTARFWTTFSANHMYHLSLLQNIGILSNESTNDKEPHLVPRQFLKAVFLDRNLSGIEPYICTCTGCLIGGVKDGRVKEYCIYTLCDHQHCYEEMGVAAFYSRGVPVMIGAMLMLTGVWTGKGVFNMEQLDPAPFMAQLKLHGLSWKDRVL